MKNTNSVRDVLNIPKNDDELNIVINSFNRANGKYFNTAISGKRFNKLRDSVCEGLGFVNGGYQELKAHWTTVNAYNIEDHGLYSGLFCSQSDASIASIISPFANALLPILCEHYPQDELGLISGDNLYILFDPKSYKPEDFGWNLIALSSASIGKYELKYGNITVGYAFNETDAVFLNAILLDLMINKLAHCAFDIDNPGARDLKWLNYVVSCGGLSETKPENYLHLRKSTMDYGLAFQFDEINLCSADLGWSHNNIAYRIYADTNDNVSMGGSELDFINIYSSKGVSLAYEDVTVSDISAIEWFAHEKLEWRTMGDDEAISVLGFAGDEHACIIK